MTKKERHEWGRELSRRRLVLANMLMSEDGCDRSVAFKLSHGAFRLYYLLTKGEVTFSYFKSNGETRCAVGTLNPELLNKLTPRIFAKMLSKPNEEARQNIENSGRITYWDLERSGFRSFYIYDLIGIEKVTIHVNKFFR